MDLVLIGLWGTGDFYTVIEAEDGFVERDVRVMVGGVEVEDGGGCGVGGEDLAEERREDEDVEGEEVEEGGEEGGEFDHLGGMGCGIYR